MHYQGTTCIWNNQQRTECLASLFVFCWNQRFDRSEIWGSSSFSLQHFAEVVRRWFISTICSGIPHDIWIKVKSTAWGFLSAAALLRMPRLINTTSVCTLHLFKARYPFCSASANLSSTCDPELSALLVAEKNPLMQFISLFQIVGK